MSKTPTPSTWMLLGTYENGQRTWQAYRMKNRNGPDTSDNREFFGKPSPRRETVLALVRALNEGEIA